MHRKLGLTYLQIDACQNDNIFYWKEHENEKKCLKCAHLKWKGKSEKGDDSDDESEIRKKGKNVPYKVLCRFPLVLRLERLFMSTKIASHKH